MNPLPHLREIFDLLTHGRHLSPEDEPLFSALSTDHAAYAAYFAPLGFNLVRHPREFFYFAPDQDERISETLPRIGAFAFILIDHLANQGQPIEEAVLGRHFSVNALPHFSLERYSSLLRQVDVHDINDLERILDHLERIGWLKWFGPHEFRLLRPFHRIFDVCIELATRAQTPAAPLNAAGLEGTPTT